MSTGMGITALALAVTALGPGEAVVHSGGCWENTTGIDAERGKRKRRRKRCGDR